MNVSRLLFSIASVSAILAFTALPAHAQG